MSHRMEARESAPVKLQYWSASHSVTAPDPWPAPLEFDSVGDAIVFAMTQAPANRELAWLRTADGNVMMPDQIRRAFELRRSRSARRTEAGTATAHCFAAALVYFCAAKFPWSGPEVSGPPFAVGIP